MDEEHHDDIVADGLLEVVMIDSHVITCQEIILLGGIWVFQPMCQDARFVAFEKQLVIILYLASCWTFILFPFKRKGSI